MERRAADPGRNPYTGGVTVTLPDIFTPGGLLARSLGDHFEARGEQLAMAEAVARAFEERSHLLVEAGTGVGKSFAYLIPAMLRVLLNQETVVIATNTIALQEQLVRKDVPLLREIVEGAVRATGGGTGQDAMSLPGDERGEANGTAGPPGVRAVLVKGRGNYVSIRRLKLASQRQDRLFADAAARRSLHQIEDWALGTTEGTLSTLPALERPGVWDKVNSDSGNCMGRKCPHYDACFYQSARREMEQANLLICNHALFFSDLALRSQEFGFLPEYHHVVLDEAHGVEDVASEHFGLTLAEGRVQHLLSTLYHQKTGKGYLPQLALVAGDGGAIDAAIRDVIAAGGAARAFFDSLGEVVRAAGEGGGSAPPGRAGPFASAFQPGMARVRRPGVAANVLTPALRELALRLKGLRDTVKGEPDRFELNAYAERAQLCADAADALIDQTLDGCAYWIEVSGGEDDGYGPQRVTLAAAPVEVGPLLKERLFSRSFSVVLTSATLATRTLKGDDRRRAVADFEASAEFDASPALADRLPTGSGAFAYTSQRLGCEGARTLQLGSPFDHARQVEFIVDRTPAAVARPAQAAGRRGDPAQSPEHLCRRILHHVAATDGGAFVLFTSFHTLRSVGRLLRPHLEGMGMPLLAQGIDGSRTHILDEFRRDERSVLLGAASFWQGVDVRGRGLRNVIITKLPFEPPDRPLTQARLERIEQQGGDPFRDDSLPRAVIRFKQGFGRLVRSQSDHGRVVVLDARIVTSSYGRAFLDALPDGVMPRIEGVQRAGEDDAWMYS